MALRLHVPLLLDVLLVWQPAEIAELDTRPGVDRILDGRRGLVNGALARRIDPGLRFDGQLLRVFRARGDASRIGADGRSAPFARLRPRLRDRYEARLLEVARYVAGHPPSRPIGCVLQELLGCLFVADFASTPRLYGDARRMERWFGLAALVGLGRGRLDRAKRRLYSAVGGDPDAFHAIAIAVHNLVDAVERMRALVIDDRTRTRLTAEAAVARCIRPPRRVLRATREPTATSFLRGDLPPGVVLLLLTRRAHRRDGQRVRPFATGRWNACPAESIVRELLVDVWQTRRREVPVIASRVWPYERIARFVGRRLLGGFTWHKLPGFLGVVRLVGLRAELRETALLDTESPPRGTLARPTRTQRAHRSADGRFNDLDLPDMGAAGRRFGRHVEPTPCTRASLLDPNPRGLSLDLMTRRVFKPAPTLNVLAAAWIQFMVHDWFNHAEDPERSISIPPPGHPADPWPGRDLEIPATRPSAAQPGEPSLGPCFDNTETHWWDASQLYGSSEATLRSLREGRGGRLLLREGGRLPLDPTTGLERSGFGMNWWIGLGVLHTLFAREHNAVCDHLAERYPDWSDDELFAKARLVVAALVAKIHTLEWTPAILDHPALHLTMRTTWNGLLREGGVRRFGRGRARSDLWLGVPGSESSHHGVRFAMTEEFVSVYRMHQLLPDRFAFFDAETGAAIEERTLMQVTDHGSVECLDRAGLASALYSLGLANAGAIELDNVPAEMQRLVRPGKPDLDLAAVDIVRDRERGVPRYNAFRRRLGLAPIERFDDLCDDPAVAERLSAAYGGDVEKLDLQVGMCAERKPAGFGFGETAFRVFTFMTVRRLKSDRFFTTDFDAATYSPEGLAWVERNDFASVLDRHAPAAATAMRGAANAFAPWAAVAAGRRAS